MTLKRSLAIARDAGAAAPDPPKIFPRNDIMNTVACFSAMNGNSTTLLSQSKTVLQHSMLDGISKNRAVQHCKLSDQKIKDTIRHSDRFELQQRLTLQVLYRTYFVYTTGSLRASHAIGA
jgi:hypothetical protein